MLMAKNIYDSDDSDFSANKKNWKTQLSKMIQSGVFALHELTEPLLKGLSSIPNKIENYSKKLEYFSKKREDLWCSKNSW